MQLLLDANISWCLAARLKLYFEDCVHVDYIGLTIPAKDIEIWNHASVNKFIIITNDDDFLNLIGIKGVHPKIVLLRTGNQGTAYIETLLIKHKADISALCESKEYGVLELF